MDKVHSCGVCNIPSSLQSSARCTRVPMYMLCSITISVNAMNIWRLQLIWEYHKNEHKLGNGAGGVPSLKKYMSIPMYIQNILY